MSSPSIERDAIVISGISGRYPESLNVHEFWEKLLSGRELSSIDDRRWPVGEWQVVLSPRAISV